MDLCGGTGAWSRPYREAGDEYDVRVITLPEADVRDWVGYKWEKPVYGVLAAPPCDHFSVSGAQYWKAKDADGRTAEALEVVDACLRIIEETNPTWWALENPVERLRRLRPLSLGQPRLKFDPWEFGDPYTKRTHIYGEFNIPVRTPVEPERVCKQGSWIQKLGGKGAKTKMLRAITPPGFAKAFFEANR